MAIDPGGQALEGTVLAVEAPAFWTIPAGADRVAVERLVASAADKLGIPVPDMSGDQVAFPPHQGKVVGALDACDPGWLRKALLLPP